MKRAQFVIAMATLILWANCGNQNPVVDPEAPAQSQRELNGLSSYQSLIDEHNADVILVNFWSAGCQACRYEVPVLNQIYHEYGDEIVLLAINIDPVKTIEQARDLAKSLGLEFDVYLDKDRKVFDAMGLRFFPTNIFYGKNKSSEPVIVNGALEFAQGKILLDDLLGN